MVLKVTGIDRRDNGGEAVWMALSATQESVQTAMGYALEAQEMNTRILRLTSQAWAESFRLQSTLFQGMAQSTFGQWENALASATSVESLGQEQSRSELTGPTTDSAEDTEVAVDEAHQKTEKEKAEKQGADEVATEMRRAEAVAEELQKSTATATFPKVGYDEMDVGEATEYLDGLSVDELKRLRKYEKYNKNRRSLRKEIKQKIKIAS